MHVFVVARLPQRLKSTSFEIFSSPKFFSKNIDFSHWGKQCIIEFFPRFSSLCIVWWAYKLYSKNFNWPKSYLKCDVCKCIKMLIQSKQQCLRRSKKYCVNWVHFTQLHPHTHTSILRFLTFDFWKEKYTKNGNSVSTCYVDIHTYSDSIAQMIENK